MRDQENLSEIKIQDQKIMKNSEPSIFEAIIPIIILVGLLAYNVFIFGDDSLSGSNQFILLIGGAVAAIVGFRNKVSFSRMMDDVAENVKSTSSAIFILLMVGALAGTWLVSGIIPTMIYYGLQILNPTIFLPACLIICAVISCLLYTSDAADEEDSVDLGGRRIIKKKKKKKISHHTTHQHDPM